MRRLIRLGQNCIVDVAAIQCIKRRGPGYGNLGREDHIDLWLKGMNADQQIIIRDVTEDQFRAIQDALMYDRPDDDDDDQATSKGEIE